jgi:hypothetical protein
MFILYNGIRIRSFLGYVQWRKPCQQSVHAFIYVQGRNRSRQESIQACIYVQGRKPFMQIICSWFYLCWYKPLCQESVHALLMFKLGKPFMPRICSCFIYVQRGKPFMIFISVKQRKEFMTGILHDFLCSR